MRLAKHLNFPMFVCRKLSSLLTILSAIILLAGNVESQPPTAVVCASLLITNKNNPDNELSGRSGCEYILQNVILKEINYNDVASLNEKLSTIYSIDGALLIDGVSYSGRTVNITQVTIRFPRLAVIRGNEVKSRSPVLISGSNYYPGLLIRQLQPSGNAVSVAFPALRVVVNGDIVISLSLQFPYSKNVNWTAYLTDVSGRQRTSIGAVSVYGTCSPSCSPNNCFGPEASDCQFPTVGTANCDSQCIGGCSGPSDPSKCFACSAMTDIVSRKCVSACPPPTDQNGNTRPDGRFTLGDTLCVKQCPLGLVKYGTNCMLRCPNSADLKTYTYERNGECYPCYPINVPCVDAAGECYPEKLNVSNGLILEDNIRGFENCTKIVGDLIFYRNFVSAANAVRYLANVTDVVGVVKIRSTLFNNFDFLNRLQTIDNRWQADTSGGAGNDAALFVENNVLVDKLGFRSLRSVRGRITITNNPKMCVPPAEVLQSHLLASGLNGTTGVIRLSGNRDPSSRECACSSKCKLSPPPTFTNQSCLAPNDPTQCVVCDSYKDASTGECLSLDQCNPPANRYVSDTKAQLCSLCHDECIGCTGPAATDCASCKNLKRTLNGECVSACNEFEYLNLAAKTCEPCHEGCTAGCYGPGNLYCSPKTPVQIPTVGCKPGCELVLYSKENASFYCYAKNCPNGYYKYVNLSSAVQPSADTMTRDTCFSKAGRAVPSPPPAYCLACAKNCFQCASYGLCYQCLPGTYEQVVTFGDYQLLDELQSPINPGQSDFSFSCVDQCYLGYYPDMMGGTGRCRKCDDACATCTGASASNCTKCRFRILEDPPPSSSKTATPVPPTWHCVAHCPNNKPIVRLFCKNDSESSTKSPQDSCVWDQSGSNSSIPTMLGECQAQESQRNVNAIIGGSVAAGLVVIVVIVVLIVVCQLRRRARDKKQTALVMQQLEPTLEPHDGATRVDSMASAFFGSSKPNMANLRLIAESSLKRGKVLGRGAFGTVYAGTWQPEPGVRVPVALKVLRRRGPAGFTLGAESPVGTGQTIVGNEVSVANNGKDQNSGAGSSSTRPPSSTSNPIDEVINEARIMCSVSHPCCVRVVGLCLGQEDVVLVTQLMQLGSLLDLLLAEKEAEQRKVGAWHLLTWAHQIADGMNYLESRGIIHRDLAARNVLVRNLTQVRITDFGLAKLLDGQQRVYRPTPGGSGERLPFKWLALESLLYRAFTHKSDVWSYGVTLWELFTFGEAPYGSGIMPDRLISLLEDGNRLPQPAIASIDVYTPLIKCWMRDPEERPTFEELAVQFKEMSADPGRYLAIPGDTHFREPNVAPIRPPSPGELLADLGVSNQTYDENAAPGFAGNAGGPGGRPAKASSEAPHQSKVVDCDEYLPSGDGAGAEGGQHQRRHNHPSFHNNQPSPRRNHGPPPANMTPTQRLAWRNNGYTVDPTSQRASQLDGGVDGRNVLRVSSGMPTGPQRITGPLTANVRVDSAIAEDYLTPTNASPANAPLLSSLPPASSSATNSGVFYDGQRTSQIPLWRGSGQSSTTTTPFSPTSSQRETVI